MKQTVAAGLAGLLFGLGLTLSGMTLPAKVIGFLDFFGAWDPTLAFVMGGALMIFGPTYFWVRRREKPLLTESFDLPTRTRVTPRLVVGATAFGVGWGLGGFCPGTALTALPTLASPVLLLVAGVLVGILVTWGAQSALTADAEQIPKADF